MITLAEMLQKLIQAGGSDLHLTIGTPPQVRVDGKLRPLDMPSLTAADTKRLAYSVMTDSQKHAFEEKWEYDFSFGIKDLCRFRANIFTQRGAVGGGLPRDPVRDQVASRRSGCRPWSKSCATSPAASSW